MCSQPLSFCQLFFPCRSALEILAAVETTMQQFGTTHVTVVGHSLGEFEQPPNMTSPDYSLGRRSCFGFARNGLPPIAPSFYHNIRHVWLWNAPGK